VAEGQADEGAWLRASASAFLSAIGCTLALADQAEYGRTLTCLRSLLGASAFEQALAAPGALTLFRAARSVLQDRDSIGN
jgi:hypothetical protein